MIVVCYLFAKDVLAEAQVADDCDNYREDAGYAVVLNDITIWPNFPTGWTLIRQNYRVTALGGGQSTFCLVNTIWRNNPAGPAVGTSAGGPNVTPIAPPTSDWLKFSVAEPCTSLAGTCAVPGVMANPWGSGPCVATGAFCAGFMYGYDLRESSPAMRMWTAVGTSTPETIHIPFVVGNQGDGDWLSIAVNSTTVLHQPLANFAVNELYWLTVPSTSFTTTSSTLWTFFIESAGASNAAVYFSLTPPDADADGVIEPIDNCTTVANLDQRDTNGDGYGNICDADLNNSGLVTATDFTIFRSVLNQACPTPANTTACNADLNGSGTVTATDFNLLRARLNTAPGPSGLHPAQ
jgi:hypothetical protein